MDRKIKAMLMLGLGAFLICSALFGISRAFKGAYGIDLEGIYYDGENLWYSVGPLGGNEVYRLGSNPIAVNHWDAPGTNTEGITSDGENLYFGEYQGSKNGTDRIWKTDKDGNILNSFLDKGIERGGAM